MLALPESPSRAKLGRLQVASGKVAGHRSEAIVARFLLTVDCLHVPVAQWPERRFPKPCVAGSSPAEDA